MKKIIAANWKNNGSKKFIKDYFDYFLKNIDSNNEIVIFPPNLYINQVNILYKDKINFMLGGQRLSCIGRDTYTNGLPSEMFIDNGCEYILVGHSEIRNDGYSILSTMNELRCSKGLQVIFCVGEDEDSRTSGNTQEMLANQLEDLCNEEQHELNIKKAIIAYEPVWAIGTGNIPKLDDISFIHRYIKTYVSENHPFLKEEDIMVLYGGSVNSKNAKEILNTPHVDGVLIGGASLDAKEFTKICNLKI